MKSKPTTHSRTFAKSLNELDRVFTYLDGIFEPVGIHADEVFAVRLVVEEIFANMVKHNVTGRRTITISVDLDETRLRVELIDHGVEPFVLTDKRPDDMDESARVGKTGGRGIYLIRRMVDEFEYDHRDGDSHVRFTMNLGSTHA